ncbi:MAG: hypothetical protein OXG96_05730 [Acidobacteria bacterium]|nr:hypothetical protein [Acidobacteriota bacterium]
MKHLIACCALLIYLGTLAFAETSVLQRDVSALGYARPTSHAVIPTAAHVKSFRTRVVIANRTTHEYSITATLYGPNGLVGRKIISMPASHYRGWDNFLRRVFDYTGNGSVVLQSESDSDAGDATGSRYKFYLTAEVYWDSGDGRFGTPVVNGIAPMVDEGDRAYNFGVSVNGDQRTNIGAFNPSDEPVSVQAEVSDESGLIETLDFEMAPYSWQQKPITARVDFGWIQWNTSGGTYLRAVSVDNRTNDGTLVYPMKPEGGAGPPTDAGESQACTAGTVLESGGRCNVNSGNSRIGTFTVNANGTSCLSIGVFTTCSGTAHNLSNAAVNQYRVTFVAGRNDDGSWTISEISISG